MIDMPRGFFNLHVKYHVKAKAANFSFTGFDRNRCISTHILHLLVTRRDKYYEKFVYVIAQLAQKILESVGKITDASFSDYRFAGFNQS